MIKSERERDVRRREHFRESLLTLFYFFFSRLSGVRLQGGRLRRTVGMFIFRSVID